MKIAGLNDERRREMLLRIRRDPVCQPALQKLQGEVLQIIITGTADYRLVFKDGSVELDPNAKPTIVAEATPDVMDAMLEGKLDPLAAILTRRLKAKIDPIRGPLLRTILRSGIGATSHDMGWEKVLGNLPANGRK